MASVLVANVPVGHTPPEVPYKDNGDFYEYFMNYENGRYLAYSDTPGELIDYLIPGYLEKDEDERILARIIFALNIQVQAQGLVLAGLTNEQREALKEWEWEVLTHKNESSPHNWGVKAGEIVEESSGETIDIWYSEVPLILVTTGYAPYTEIPRPISALGASRNEANLFWLDPSDEDAFLETLGSINYIYLARRLND